MGKPGYPLRLTLPALVFGLGAVIAGASILVSNWQTEQSIFNAARTYLVDEGRSFASELQSALRRSDPSSARALLMQIPAGSRIGRAALTNPDATIRFSTRLREVGQPLSATDLAYGEPLLEPARERRTPLTRRSANGDRLLLVNPVLLEPRPGNLIPSDVGFLVLELDLALVQAQALQNTLRRGLVVLGATGALCLLLAVLLHFWIAKPLRALEKQANAIAGGTFNARTAISRNDEIGALAAAINAMAGDLGTTMSELQAREEQFRNLVEGSIQGIFISDGRRFLFANRALADLLGYGSPAELAAVDAITAVFPQDEARSLANLLDARANGGASEAREVVARHRNGDTMRLLMMAGGIEWQNAPACLGTVVDLTEQKRSEEQLRQSQKMEAVGKLTGGVAHDFNNILAIVSGNLELAAERERDAKIKGMLEVALNASRRGAQLIRRLMAFARRQPLSPQPVDAGTLLQGMSDLLRRTLGEDVEVQISVDDDLGACVVDANELENVIINLVINSRDAMPDGGRLTITARNASLTPEETRGLDAAAPGSYVCISVNDTGVGMSKEVAALAFDPFYTTKEVGKGTGLGLSMVYGFVKQSRGHIQLSSEPGRGTTIRIYLPRTEAPATAELPSTPATGEAIGGNREVVLVVEDAPDLRRIIVSQLAELGYRTLEAANGAEAIANLSRAPKVDLVLTDVVLPGGLSGGDIAAKARELEPETRVLFMSGYSEEAVVQHGLGPNTTNLLQKPFQRTELAHRVHRALRA